MNHETPFFILANPRSGSSLLRIICDCNPALSVPPESGFLLWWSKKYANVTPEKLGSSEILDSILDDILSSRKIETWNLNKERLLSFILKERPQNYSELGSLIYFFHANERGKDSLVWGDKNNYYIHHLNEIKAIFPRAKYIHLVRDGRDVGCSYRNLSKIKSDSAYFPNLPSSVEEIASEWKDNNEKIRVYLNNLRPQDHLLVRYEDLILSLDEVCERICNFLNVPFSPLMLEYDRLNREQGLEPGSTLDWKMKTLQKPDKSRIAQYKEQLTREEQNDFERIAGEELANYGYVE